MHNNSKIFRLFISSTFSDFQVERETLQTKIFPEIKEYCSGKGYTFQPIDLRWGVSDEAQLDQKALEICIKEVQSSKRHDYPNFLIMLGDRYGWVPIPNILEANEFELIIKNLNPEEKELLFNWYYEDKNQIPTSYILKQRTDEYIDYDKWLNIECTLRRIFQNAIENFDDTLRTKFITSATESEAIEGIISYLKRTEHQKQLLQLTPELDQLDHKHIFGFFRDIDKNSIIEDKFISDDYDKAQEFKNKVQRQLVSENILHVNTSQVSKDKLNEKYLDAFTESILKFLKSQIEQQIKNNEEENYTNLELEKKQQYNYLNEKLENFLGQEKALDAIKNYINNGDTKPLIICGKSGIGKSSIMAKAIEDTSNTFSKKIIYRFIGATPNTKTTKDLLISILEELNITSKDEKNNTNNPSFNNEQSDFISFSDIFHNAMIDMRDDLVIFIDAVDQLSNDDQFLWLPNNLPSNVKIVLSALKDRNYKDDSKYFYMLENKISKFIEIEPFNKPIELLELLLLKQNRILQNEQKEYFLKQYNQVDTPLYVYMAANQLLYWKSSDTVETDVTLSLSQKDIVNVFIENLTSLHHHNNLLVQKIFGYMLASKDGLSEYEILELLNTDKEFIKTIAPNTWHINSTQELPLVIWSRLFNHIKPFLSKKNQDGQELLYLFHREFIDVIENRTNQIEEHKNMIEATQKLIKKHLDKEFDSNRWGKLYITLLVNYYITYKDDEKVFQYYEDIFSFLKSEMVLKYLKCIIMKRDESANEENNSISKHLTKLTIHISNKYKKLADEFYFYYIFSLHTQANILIHEKNYTAALKIEKKNLKNIKSLPNFQEIIKIENNDEDTDITLKWLDLYLTINNSLGFLYTMAKDEECIVINKKIHLMFKEFYNNKNTSTIKILYHDQINYYAMALQTNGVIFEAIDLLKESLDILKINYHSDNTNFQLKAIYAKTLSTLSGIAFSVKDKKWHDYFFNAYKIYNELLKYNFFKYSKILIELNNYYINNYNANNMFLKSELYYKNNISLLHRQGNEGVEEKINEISNDLFMKILDLNKKEKKEELFFVNKRLIEYVFNFDKEYWALKYVEKLIALGNLLSKSKIDDDRLSIAETLQEEGVNICEQYMIDDDKWYDYYTINMNNLANTCLYLNKKNKSFEINKKNLDFSTRLFQKDQQKWFRAYYYALECMASTHSSNGDDENEKVCRDKIEELESNPLFQFEKDVIQNKSADKKIKYFDYFHKALLLLGVYFFIKYVFLE